VKVACVTEGETEYVCVPKIVGRLGHVVISNVHAGGCVDDWDLTFERKILPYVKTAALKSPDKILIVVDREKRPLCCGGLASRALQILSVGLTAENLTASLSLVISDRKFESIIMADYELMDRLPILSRSVSPDFGIVLDGTDPKAVVDRALKPGKKYDKVRHGGALASSMRLEDLTVQSRSRSLRKLLKELT